ncbi:hypothetical protein Tco_0789603 [Tanacetum coccineum]
MKKQLKLPIRKLGLRLMKDGDKDDCVLQLRELTEAFTSNRRGKAKTAQPWTTTEEITLCTTWCNVMDNYVTRDAMKRGFWSEHPSHQADYRAVQVLWDAAYKDYKAKSSCHWASKSNTKSLQGLQSQIVMSLGQEIKHEEIHQGTEEKVSRRSDSYWPVATKFAALPRRLGRQSVIKYVSFQISCYDHHRNIKCVRTGGLSHRRYESSRGAMSSGTRMMGYNREFKKVNRGLSTPFYLMKTTVFILIGFCAIGYTGKDYSKMTIGQTDDELGLQTFARSTRIESSFETKMNTEEEEYTRPQMKKRTVGALKEEKEKLEKQLEGLTWRLQLEKRLKMLAA